MMLAAVPITPCNKAEIETFIVFKHRTPHSCPEMGLIPLVMAPLRLKEYFLADWAYDQPFESPIADCTSSSFPAKLFPFLICDLKVLLFHLPNPSQPLFNLFFLQALWNC